MDTILHEIFMAIATAAASAITAYAVQQARRNGLEITVSQQELMKKYEVEAIMYAEEQAWAFLKKTGAKMTSGEKLKLASDYLAAHSPFHKGMSNASIDQKITSTLASGRKEFSAPGLR